MCGISGYLPKKGKKADLDKMFMLAIANEERGTDSCGVAIGNDYCQHGVTKLSKARDFILENKEDMKKVDLLNKPIIFHSRKSTVGSHNKINSHPMRYSWKHEGGEEEYLTLAHNGSVTETWDMFGKFVKPYSTKAKWVDYIDTRVFAHGFANAFCAKDYSRILEMLKTYKGAAAFLFYTNTHFYVWKGAAGDVEERPMYYVETEDGWYFHSISSILEITFNMKPTCVANNTLLTFTQAGIVDTLVIPRAKAAVTTYNHSGGYYGDEGYYKPTASNKHSTAITAPLKINNLGYFVHNNKLVENFLPSHGTFCRGFAVYYDNADMQKVISKVIACTTQEDFDKFLLENKLKGFVGRIPIVNNKNQLVALYDVNKNDYIREGEIFKDTRTFKEYIYKNQKVEEYVTSSNR